MESTVTKRGEVELQVLATVFIGEDDTDASPVAVLLALGVRVATYPIDDLAVVFGGGFVVGCISHFLCLSVGSLLGTFHLLNVPKGAKRRGDRRREEKSGRDRFNEAKRRGFWRVLASDRLETGSSKRTKGKEKERLPPRNTHQALSKVR